jgi:IS30 family transposase
MKKGTTYSQLSYEERVKISTLQEEGYTVRYIASVLGRSPNTISHELRTKKVKRVYNPKKAHQKTYQRRYRSKRMCLKVAIDRHLEKEVRTQLRKRISPERISGYFRRIGVTVSAKAIRKYAKSRSMEYCFFWSWNKKRGGPKRRQHRAWDQLKRHVSERPMTTCSGHWEVDFIVSKQSPAVLMVLVDRWTRFTIVEKLERKTHENVSRVFAEKRSQYVMKSITTDNDIVFQTWLSMEAFLHVPFYFTTPYTSQEKGLVENTNRWIRCFVPKKRDIATVTDDELRSIESYLNDVPRQCLDFYTARELLVIHKRVS